MNYLNRFITLLLLLLVCAGARAEQADALSLYWSISRDGEPAGYLLGTIHSEDPRVLDYPDRFIGEISSNQFFAMEMVPDLPTLMRLTEYMQYQDGSTLESHIGADRYGRLQTALQAYKVPDELLGRMKIWAAMMTLSTPPPQTGFFMDFSLSLRAAGAGLKVVGLETLEQQLSFLEEMPTELQLNLLDQALEDYAEVERIHREMVDVYMVNDLERLMQQAEEQLGALDEQTRNYFIEKGINERNTRMLQSLLPQLEKGRVFVATGALHLPGEMGLVEMLRRQGYQVTPLPLPLSAPEQGH